MTSENALGIKHRTTWQICHYQQSTVLTKTESESTRSAAARLMVKKCANSSCETVFRYFRGGKIFVVEAARVGEAASSTFFTVANEPLASKRSAAISNNSLYLKLWIGQ